MRKVVADLWDAWNKHDIQGIVRNFSEHHDHLNVYAGFVQWTKSREQAQYALGLAHRPKGVLADTQVKSALVEKLHFLRPDAAVAIVETTWGDNNRSRSTSVLSKEDGKWQIRNFQITGQVDTSKLPPR